MRRNRFYHRVTPANDAGRIGAVSCLLGFQAGPIQTGLYNKGNNLHHSHGISNDVCWVFPT